jgi:tetraacyldisaccharide 4'-kinase
MSMPPRNSKRSLTLESHWYRSSYSWLTLLLLPLSWLFRLIVALRYFFYRFKIKKTFLFNVPVIVVGNITVGGTGKTPFVIWLAHFLQKEGFSPGIVSRGMGGEQLNVPYWVDAVSDPAVVGDEALLLVRRTHCPMVVGVDRVAAVKELLQKTNCNIVISDDGLQHYRLGRTIEIAIIDGERRFGNGCLLPSGPLREPLKRLKRVDVVVVNGAKLAKNEEYMHLEGSKLISLVKNQQIQSVAEFKNKTVHAVAGIGNPNRFFNALRNENIQLIEHLFPDHYLYQASDIHFSDDLPVIMTEKDAVKCIGFADERHWYLPVQAEMSKGVEIKIVELLKRWRRHA